MQIEKVWDFREIEANGVRLRAVVKGEGPLCVMVHGWPESWYSWRHQIPAVAAAGYRVCAIDVRGYGGSEKPWAIEAYDLASLVGDVIGVIDALGEERAVLVGHDWGAPIVWTTAVLHRDRVRAAIGMSVPHLGRPRRPVPEMWREVFRDRFFYQVYFQEPGVAEAELEADIPATLRKTYFAASGDATEENRGFRARKKPGARFLDGMVDPDPLPAWLSEADLAYYASQFEQSGFRGPLNRYRNFERDWELLPELGERAVEVPALFLAGSRDPVLRFDPSVDLFARAGPPFYTDLRDKRLIEGAGHWVQQERPEATNRAILAFLENL